MNWECIVYLLVALSALAVAVVLSECGFNGYGFWRNAANVLIAASCLYAATRAVMRIFGA